MEIEIPAGNLLVMEYSGTARGGKGSLTGDISERYENVAVEEAGADYRMVTRVLWDADVIDPEMSPENIATNVSKVDVAELTDIVAGRKIYQQTHGLDALHQPEVTTMVGFVSPIDTVRTAVKAGFTKRVEAVRDDSERDILLVDGRNLASVVKKIDGVELGLRTFVSCLPAEAAWREIVRQGMKIGTKEAQEAFVRELQSAKTRNDADANREIDPVRPDVDAIDYWRDIDVQQKTWQWYAKQDGYPGSASDWYLDRYAQSDDYQKPEELLRRSVGVRAVFLRKQINFDTSPFRTQEKPKESMIDAANIMFEEAVATHRQIRNAIRAAVKQFDASL